MKHPTLGRTPTRVLSLPAPTGGVDVSSPPNRINDNCLSDAINLWHRDGVLTTRPSLCERGAVTADGAVEAVSLGAYTLLHTVSGNRHLLALTDADGNVQGTVHTLSGECTVTAVPSERDITAADGREALVFIHSTDTAQRGVFGLSRSGALTRLTPFVPTLLSAARPSATEERTDTGAYLQPFNRLTEEFRCCYTADSEGLYYWLPDGVLPDMTQPFTVRYDNGVGYFPTHTVTAQGDDGIWREEFATVDDIPPDELALRVDAARGCFWFVHAHGGGVAPIPGTVTNSVTVTAHRCPTDGIDRVCGMRFGTWYGGTAGGTRLFLAGHPQHPNTVLWSALGDPLYFPENNRAYVGDAAGAITALGKQNELLVIFKEHELYAICYTAGDTVTAADLLSGTVTDTEAAAAVFPITQLHPAVGCDCPQTVRLCGDRLYWMCADGRVYTLETGGTYDARRVRRVSQAVEAELCRYTTVERREASAACHEGHYLLQLRRNVYVLDTETHVGAWYLWALPCDGKLAPSRTGTLFLTDGGTVRVHTLGDGADDTVAGSRYPLTSRLCTKWYELGAPGSYKHLIALRLWLTGDRLLTVALCDGPELASLRLRGSTLTDTPPLCVPIGITRVRYGGIVLTCTGRMTVDRLELTYRRMGEIHE